MSRQEWYRCDFPKCEKRAEWRISRPGYKENPARNAMPPLEDFCFAHGAALMADSEKFTQDAKEAAR